MTHGAFASRAHLANVAADPSRPEVRIVAEPAAPARLRQDHARRCRHARPRSPPGHTHAAAHTYRACRLVAPEPRRRAQATSSRCALLAASSAAPSRSARPDQRLLRTPGAPPSASTSSPESRPPPRDRRCARETTAPWPAHSPRTSSKCLECVLVRRLGEPGPIERLHASRRPPSNNGSSSRSLPALRVAITTQRGDAGRGASPPVSDALSSRPRALRRVERADALAPPGRAARPVRRGANVPFSPVPCTSTKRPSLLMTTFMSTPARTSSS